MKIFYGAWSCSLEQTTKSMIKTFVIVCIKVLQVDIGFQHDVLVCSESIAQTFENPKYVKPPNEGITSCVLKMFSPIRVLQT
jgi:hypothetical protein